MLFIDRVCSWKINKKKNLYTFLLADINDTEIPAKYTKVDFVTAGLAHINSNVIA